MKIQIWTLSMLISAGANSAEVCKTLSECEVLSAQVDAKLMELSGSRPSALGAALRDSNGRIRTNIDGYEANELCDRLGLRLPTAREIAKDAVKYGAVMVEAQDFKAGKFPAGYSANDFMQIAFMNFAARLDVFYLSSRNYKRSASDKDGNADLWTSSLNEYSAEYPAYNEVGVGFMGKSGTFVGQNRHYHSDKGGPNTAGSVRCVKVAK